MYGYQQTRINYIFEFQSALRDAICCQFQNVCTHFKLIETRHLIYILYHDSKGEDS